MSEEKTTPSDEQEMNVSFNTYMAPQENKSITHLIQHFSSDFSEQLCRFIGKMVQVEFSSLECIQTNERVNQRKSDFLSTFSINSSGHYGLIILDAGLLDLCINFLFGHFPDDEIKELHTFGKCSLKIAREITLLGLHSLQKIISEYIDFNPSLIKTSNHFKDINHQNIGEKYYEFKFKITETSHSQEFIMLIPEKIIEEIVFKKQQDNSSHVQSETEQSHEHLKSEVIDTTVDLVALLPDIKIKLSDVMNLKPGYLIPIADPNEVELRVGNKRLFKGLAGQANSFKVVKTGEPINKS